MRLPVFLAILVPLAFQAATAQHQTLQDSARWGDELPELVRLTRPAPDSIQSPVPSLPVPPLRTPPDEIRAIYLNAWTFGSKRFYDLVRLADTTEINAFVIDVKDDTGYLTYRSSVPTAVSIGANTERRARDTRERLDLLHRKGIYPIARIVVAKDPLLASRKPEWSVQSTAGGLWRDRLDFAWVDAFNDSIWVYAADLGAEAVRMGFAELQFDYVRFPDEPRSRMASAIFPGRRDGETTRQGVTRNLRLLRERVKPLGVPFTLDVFGMTTSATADLGIGQVWEDLSATADVLLPMVYPSHYYNAFHGIGHPNSEPYRVVRLALEDGLARQTDSARARIRPYLQAFTLGKPRYTPWHVREQIRAAKDVGINSWVLWNAAGRYDPAIFRGKDGTLPAAAMAQAMVETDSVVQETPGRRKSGVGSRQSAGQQRNAGDSTTQRSDSTITPAPPPVPTP